MNTMTGQPRLSVVIACYNQTRELELTLGSFLAQSCDRALYELIVIDDGSSDHSARALVGRVRREYTDATVLYARHHRRDAGSYGSSARVKNIGVRLSRGDHVFFNNAEIVQAGESLSYILSRVDAAATPLCLRGRVIDLDYDALRDLTPARRESLHDRTDRARERVATADHAGLAVMPRALLSALGANDERFDYWGKEDLDLAARLKRAGCTYVYDEHLKSFHVSHPPNHVKTGDYQRMIALLNENNTRQAVEVNAGRLWGALNAAAPASLAGTIVVEADGDGIDLRRRLEDVVYAPGAERHEVIVACLDSCRPAVEAIVLPFFRPMKIVTLAADDSAGHGSRLARHVSTSRVAFLPVGATYAPLPFDAISATETALMPWMPELARASQQIGSHALHPRAWLGSIDVLAAADGCGGLQEWSFLRLAGARTPSGAPVAWRAARLGRTPDAGVPSAAAAGLNRALDRRSTIAALIPYTSSASELAACLESLVTQSRPLDAIVVVDAHSGTPPVDIVRTFPGVTLLRAVHHTGTWRLVQQVIDETAYDGYLFQDADDWSSADRLELLLREAERTAADMVGSQHVRLDMTGAAHAICHPLEVTHAPGELETHVMLHPSTLASRDLLLRVGHAARIVNVPDFCYFQRRRADSAAAAQTFAPAGSIRLEHVIGPPLRMADCYAGRREGAGEFWRLSALGL
jgi:glycosyltransferase involved in cell wall biosynthesis